MDNTTKATRENRTITVDFHNEATSMQLLGDGKAFVECVLAFLLALGFQLTHKVTCHGGGCLTRHSYYARVRLGGLTIWRMQCTTCQAVFTVLPHFVLRYRRMNLDIARQALIATHGGLSLEWCAVICNISPMAVYRLICAFGHASLVVVHSMSCFFLQTSYERWLILNGLRSHHCQRALLGYHYQLVDGTMVGWRRASHPS